MNVRTVAGLTSLAAFPSQLGAPAASHFHMSSVLAFVGWLAGVILVIFLGGLVLRGRDALTRRLKREEQKFRALLESSPDAVYTIEPATLHIQGRNRRAAEMDGYSDDDLAYLTALDLHPPEERPMLRETFRKAVETGRAFPLHALHYERNDGRLVQVDGSLTIVEAGDEKFFLCVVRDITEREQAEEALRQEKAFSEAVIESLPDRFFVIDSEGRYLRWNKDAGKSLGYSSEEFAALDPLANIAEDERTLAAGKIQEAFEKGSTTGDFHLVSKDGRKIPHLLTIRRSVIGEEVYLVGIAVNITARKQAEKMLQEYEKVVEGSDEMIAVVDREYRYLLANRAFLEQRGKTRGEVMGHSVQEVVGQDFYERVAREKLEECFRGNVVRFEMKCEYPRLGEREVLASYFPIEGPQGVDRAACVMQDITERTRAERAVEESEARYRTLFENSPVGIYRSTPDGRVLAGNPALVKMLGYSSFEELAARDLNAGPFEPEYRRDEFMALMEKHGEVTGLESAWHKRNGDVLYVRENARATRDESGKIVCYEGTLEDITERKRTEAELLRLVTAIEQSAEGVMITNTAGDIEYVNPAFARTTGYTREEVLGHNTKILKSGKHEPEFYRQLWATILKGETWHGEIINQRKDGSCYTEEMHIAPVRGTRGELTHFIATKQDVTERRTLEARLQQTAKMEAVGRLAGGVAHDFNNLLTIINGYSDLLLNRYGSDDTARAYLREIKNAGEHAATLTRQLLAFSRRQVLDPQVIDLNLVVANLEKMLKRLIGEDIQLRTRLDPALCRVKADAGQIEQVIMNLAVNARDAMPAGGKLTLETQNLELDEAYARSHASVKPGPHAMLAIVDTGVGMSRETMAHIFEPFFTTKEQGKGTGLGLATVYGIVKQSGGSIWVYSEPGHGTVFKVYLPAVSERPPQKRPASTETESAPGSETILMVEDDEGVRSLIRLALESSGYNVLEMKDGEAALATCANYAGPIHLLLTDVVMPRTSGQEVAEKVAALRPGIKVLYMSGYTDDAVLHRGMLPQNMPFIQKPFSPVALRKRIREVLEGK